MINIITDVYSYTVINITDVSVDAFVMETFQDFTEMLLICRKLCPSD